MSCVLTPFSLSSLPFPDPPSEATYDDRTVAAICSTTEATAAAYRVISVLCTGSLENLKAVYSKLQELFYTGGLATELVAL